MLIKVGNRFSLIEIDFEKIEMLEDLTRELGIETFYNNHFQIIEGSVIECLKFISFFSFDLLSSIKNFYGQEFSLFYKPYQQTNYILIQNTDTFKEVEDILRNMEIRYKPKVLA